MSETRLTPARRAELARLCEAATPGPWYQAEHNPEQVLGEHGFITAVACSTPSIDARSMRQRASDQAAFIAASRTALPEALAEVDRLTARWEALKVWARDCDLSVDVDDMTIEMTRLECEQ